MSPKGRLLQRAIDAGVDPDVLLGALAELVELDVLAQAIDLVLGGHTMSETRSNPPSNSDPFLNVEQAAAYLGMSVRFIRHEIAQNNLTVVRLGRLIKVRQSDLEHYVNARTTEPHLLAGSRDGG